MDAKEIATMPLNHALQLLTRPSRPGCHRRVSWPPSPALDSLRPANARATPGDAAFLHLWTHSAEFLLQRSERPPAAPKDWRLEVKLSCHCEDCRELQKFVLHPVEQIHRFRMRQDRRSHLENQISHHALDIKGATDRSSNPQTLVCTKDRRSYQRRCEQYRKDIAAMATLVRLGDGASAENAALMKRLEAARQQAGEWTPS